jgi:hypothetical protein
MIRRLDNLWFHLLGEAHFWIMRRACAHRRREALRRLERHVAWQNAHLN